MEKRVVFYSQGQRIFGNLHLPYEGAPCILMSHGLEGSKDGSKWRFLSPRFYDEGFASLRFNYRGCGGVERSEGESEDTTLTGRIKDYKAALDYLETAKVDLKRLGVIGSSFGGMVALAAEDKRVKAIIIMATPSRFPLPRSKGLFFAPKVKGDFYQDLQAYDLCQSIKRASCPILIIQGEHDELVPMESTYELYENANEPKRLEILEGAEHRLNNPKHLERIATLSLEWFKRYL